MLFFHERELPLVAEQGDELAVGAGEDLHAALTAQLRRGVGVGAARRVSAVRWNVASSIVYAWVITIPASAIIAALTYWAVNLIPFVK